MVHMALIEYYLFGNTLIKKQTYRNEYKKLNELVDSKKSSITRLELQYQVFIMCYLEMFEKTKPVF